MPAVAPFIVRVSAIPVLSMRRVRKSFARGLARAVHRTAVLRNVDLDLYAGEVLGIAGDEGAGKTTLLQCAAGLLRCDAGDIAWFGEPREHDGLFPHVGFVSAVPVFYPFLTVREVLELRGACVAGTSVGTPNIEAALASTSLALDAGRFVAQLSRDEVARLAVAEALLCRPRALLLDTRFNDRSWGVSPETCYALGDYAARGGAVMIAARDASSVSAVATRCVRVAGGSVDAVSHQSSNVSAFVEQSRHAGRFVAERMH